MILQLVVYKKKPENTEDENEQWGTEERVQRLVANAIHTENLNLIYSTHVKQFTGNTSYKAYVALS